MIKKTQGRRYILNLLKKREGGNNLSEYITNSVLLSEKLGKRHNNILRDIDVHIEKLKKLESGDRSISPYLDALFGIKITEYDYTKYFIESKYKNSRNRTYRCYKITRKGIDLLLWEYRNIKFMNRKLIYIDEFNEIVDSCKGGFKNEGI